VQLTFLAIARDELVEAKLFYNRQENGLGESFKREAVHQDNRESQSEFVCLSCGNQVHADHNAAKVIAMRGVQQLLSGQGVQKEKKRCRMTRIKVWAEGSKLFSATQSTPSETVVSRMGGNTSALWSFTLETPATTPVFGI
jgi:putative transposase